MAHMDPLQFNEVPVKKRLDGIMIGFIISLIIAIMEFIIILCLTAGNSKEPESTTTEVILITTENVASVSDATKKDATEEEIITTEEVTTVEETTEATTEAVNELTLKPYYSLFANYQNIYNSHKLVNAVESAYLPQLKDVIFTQQLQSANAKNEDEYWKAMNDSVGGNVNVIYEPTEEVVLDKEKVDALTKQLAEYKFTEPIDEAYSISITETFVAAEDGAPKKAAYNKYIIISSNGSWWIVGRQAQ